MFENIECGIKWSLSNSPYDSAGKGGGNYGKNAEIILELNCSYFLDMMKDGIKKTFFANTFTIRAKI